MSEVSGLILAPNMPELNHSVLVHVRGLSPPTFFFLKDFIYCDLGGGAVDEA